MIRQRILPSSGTGVRARSLILGGRGGNGLDIGVRRAIGVASVLICRPLATTLARSAFGVVRGLAWTLAARNTRVRADFEGVSEQPFPHLAFLVSFSASFLASSSV
jgi:hypothetical protein